MVKQHLRETKDKLERLRSSVEQRLRHRGMNLALVVFGLLFGALFFLLSFNEQRITFLPEFLTTPLTSFLFVVGAYFVAALLIRLTADLFIKILRDAEIEHKLLLRKAYIGLVYAIATLVILWRLGLSVQNLTILVGFMATGLAFAVRDIIVAYLAWYVLLVKRPFRIGDYIKIGEDEGKVMHIGTFFVLIDNSPQTREDFVRIPGKTFLDKPVVNYGSENPLCQWKVRLARSPAASSITRALSQIAKTRGVQVQARLDADLEGLFLAISFRCPFDIRGAVKEEILKALLKERVDIGKSS